MDEFEGDCRLARLQEELTGRDEIIVALQHVVRDLRHEIENLRAEHIYTAFARGARSSDRAELCRQDRPRRPVVAERSKKAADEASSLV